MLLDNVKRCLLKNLNITRLHEMMLNNITVFDQMWKPFLDFLRIVNSTKIVGI